MGGGIGLQVKLSKVELHCMGNVHKPKCPTGYLLCTIQLFIAAESTVQLGYLLKDAAKVAQRLARRRPHYDGVEGMHTRVSERTLGF